MTKSDSRKLEKLLREQNCDPQREEKKMEKELK